MKLISLPLVIPLQSLQCTVLKPAVVMIGLRQLCDSHIGARTPIRRREETRSGGSNFYESDSLTSCHHQLCAVLASWRQWVQISSIFWVQAAAAAAAAAAGPALLTGPRVGHRPAHAERASQGPLPVWQQHIF